VWWASFPPPPFCFSRAACSTAARRLSVVRPHGNWCSLIKTWPTLKC
jgi:hypothetical protein